jgi:hypothetical protein
MLTWRLVHLEPYLNDFHACYQGWCDIENTIDNQVDTSSSSVGTWMIFGIVWYADFNCMLGIYDLLIARVKNSQKHNTYIREHLSSCTCLMV